MTQEERWVARYNEEKSFIEENHRNPSKYNPEERLMIHFLKRNRKLLNADALSEDRREKFFALLELCEKYRRVNQYE
jgi:hypothetical protein